MSMLLTSASFAGNAKATTSFAGNAKATKSVAKTHRVAIQVDQNDPAVMNLARVVQRS